MLTEVTMVLGLLPITRYLLLGVVLCLAVMTSKCINIDKASTPVSSSSNQVHSSIEKGNLPHQTTHERTEDYHFATAEGSYQRSYIPQELSISFYTATSSVLYASKDVSDLENNAKGVHIMMYSKTDRNLEAILTSNNETNKVTSESVYFIQESLFSYSEMTELQKMFSSDSSEESYPANGSILLSEINVTRNTFETLMPSSSYSNPTPSQAHTSTETFSYQNTSSNSFTNIDNSKIISRDWQFSAYSNTIASTFTDVSRFIDNQNSSLTQTDVLSSFIHENAIDAQLQFSSSSIYSSRSSNTVILGVSTLQVFSSQSIYPSSGSSSNIFTQQFSAENAESLEKDLNTVMTTLLPSGSSALLESLSTPRLENFKTSNQFESIMLEYSIVPSRTGVYSFTPATEKIPTVIDCSLALCSSSQQSMEFLLPSSLYTTLISQSVSNILPQSNMEIEPSSSALNLATPYSSLDVITNYSPTTKMSTRIIYTSNAQIEQSTSAGDVSNYTEVITGTLSHIGSTSAPEYQSSSEILPQSTYTQGVNSSEAVAVTVSWDITTKDDDKLKVGETTKQDVNIPTSTTPMTTTENVTPKLIRSTTKHIDIPGKVTLSTSTKKNDNMFTKRPTKWSGIKTKSEISTTPLVILPQVYIIIAFQMNWLDFCANYNEFRDIMAKLVESEVVHVIHRRQIIIANIYHCSVSIWYLRQRRESNDISVSFYVVNFNGQFDRTLTDNCYQTMQEDRQTFVGTSFQNKMLYVSLVGGTTTTPSAVVTTETRSKHGLHSGVIVASVVAPLVVFLLAGIAVFCILSRRRRGKAMRSYFTDSRQPSFDSRIDIPLSNYPRIRRSGRGRKSTRSQMSVGFINEALQYEEGLPSNPVNTTGLAKLCYDMDLLGEEFRLLPNLTARLSDLPDGCDDKNRFANVIPNAETRVLLSIEPRDRSSHYINANFVRGYMKKAKTYIATQAPLENTTYDFWRMIWEYRSQVIVMLTDLKENDLPKCFPYWPSAEGSETLQQYGELEIILKKRDVKQDFIISKLRLKNTKTRQWRDLVHFWYLAWPYQGVPESPISLLNFLDDVRPYMEISNGPTVVHCSPGTGRTGTFLAIHICLEEFDDSQSVDVLGCVHRLRQDRGGAVQTKEQYIFIYTALNDYSSPMSENLTPASSSASLTEGDSSV